MHTTHTVDDLLTTLAAVLGRCALMALGLIALWGLLLVFAPEFTFNIQRALLDITRPQFNLIHFGGLGLAKVATFWLFVMPYIVVRLVIRARRQR